MTEIRPASTADAASIAALATQVFLDTYAPKGVRPDLAREAFREYSELAFLVRLRELQRRILLAMQGDALVGFAEFLWPAVSPLAGVTGMELVRLYVQPRGQRRGIGKRLICEVENAGAASSATSLWLTVWEGNASALAFYDRMGYVDAGAAAYSFEGNTYMNRVLAKRLAGPA